MSWVRLDDGFGENPKVLGLSPGSFRAFVRSICWVARHETDGMMNAAAIRTFATPRQKAELVDAGLLIQHENGSVEVHDYLVYNPSKAQCNARREATKRRVYAHRNGVTAAVTNAPPQPQPQDPKISTPADAGVLAAATDRDLTDSEAETVCPLDLYDRARDGGVLRQLSDRLGQPLVSVEDAAREFVAYWTIGEGAGQRRRRWLAKLRQQVVKRAERNQLRAPGAIAHGGDSNVTPIHPDVAKFLAGGRT